MHRNILMRRSSDMLFDYSGSCASDTHPHIPIKHFPHAHPFPEYMHTNLPSRVHPVQSCVCSAIVFGSHFHHADCASSCRNNRTAPAHCDCSNLHDRVLTITSVILESVSSAVIEKYAPSPPRVLPVARALPVRVDRSRVKRAIELHQHPLAECWPAKKKCPRHTDQLYLSSRENSSKQFPGLLTGHHSILA